MNHKNQRGFAHIIVIVLAVVVLGAAAGTGYYVWHRNHKSSQPAASKSTGSSQQHSGQNQPASSITNYDECAKAPGSILLQTYPTVCKAKDGQSFTQSTAQQQAYLTIKEWGVQVPYSGSDTFTYQMSGDGSMAMIFSQELADKYGCTVANAHTNSLPSGAGSISRYLGTAAATHLDISASQNETVAQYIAKSYTEPYAHIGNYYYIYTHDQAACSEKTYPTEAATAGAVGNVVRSLVPKLTAIQ